LSARDQREPTDEAGLQERQALRTLDHF
jgi:hypothetical protein